jgi:hypothetical protein
MQVRNVHARDLPASVEALGALIDSLASKDDRLWPSENWPRMAFDRPLSVGAIGGHGPIRYTIEQYQRARLIKFRFTAPRGFDGFHAFGVESRKGGASIRHELVMRTFGRATLSWPMVFRPLHDALIEDALDKAELATTDRIERSARWSLYVRLLRKAAKRLRLGRGEEDASLTPT